MLELENIGILPQNVFVETLFFFWLKHEHNKAFQWDKTRELSLQVSVYISPRPRLSTKHGNLVTVRK